MCIGLPILLLHFGVMHRNLILLRKYGIYICIFQLIMCTNSFILPNNNEDNRENHLKIAICVISTYSTRYFDQRFTGETLSIRRKKLSNQSINQSINPLFR